MSWKVRCSKYTHFPHPWSTPGASPSERFTCWETTGTVAGGLRNPHRGSWDLRVKEHLMFTFEMQPFRFLFSSLHSHLPGFSLNLGPLSLLISPAFLALDRFSSSLGKHSCLGGPFVCEHQSSTNANVPALEEKPWIVEAYFNSLHWAPYRPESCDHNRASCISYVHVALSLIPWFYLLSSLTLSSSLSAHYFYCHP